MIAKHQNFDQLIDNVHKTHCQLQFNAQKAVNLNLTIRNWLVGCYIVEFEQNGEDRAKYGTRLLEEMAKRIKAKGIKGLDIRTLRSCRTFYNIYPQIRGLITPELQKRLPIQIRGSVTPELPEEHPISPETLLSRLSFTHFIELLRKDDPLERLFYEVEKIKNNWNVKELKRAINTALYIRTGLS